MPPLADPVDGVAAVRGGSMLGVASLLEGSRYRASLQRTLLLVRLVLCCFGSYEAKEYETVKNLEK